jgi:hypothetical protein
VTDSVGTAGDEFAWNADSARRMIGQPKHTCVRRSPSSACGGSPGQGALDGMIVHALVLQPQVVILLPA